MPDAIVLSHYAERARLVRAHPRVLPMALVGGDSSYDRLVASLPFRGLYRCAFGVGAGQRLVVAAPDPRSCRSHELPARLLAELPRDRYRVLAFLRSEESEGSRGSALTGRPRDGLSLAPAEADWRAAFVAADWIVGDDAEVLPYAAVTGTPVLLTLPSGDRADPVAGMAELARVAPRLSSRRRVRAQLCRAEEQYRPDRYRSVSERITSQPGLFNRNVRSLIYRLLGLRQPATIPAADPVSPPYRIESPSHETEKRRA